MKNILKDKRAYDAIVGLTTKLHALGVSTEVLKQTHSEVGDLVRVGIEIGTEETVKKVFGDAKENTTTRNSDVYDDVYGPKYHKTSFMLNKIKRFLEQDY